MASIFDDDFGDGLPKDTEQKPRKRGKHRESLTSTEIRQGHAKLLDMVESAFETLEAATREADFPTAIKAAQIILDRAGFGPKSTVDVNTTSLDLSQLSREELAIRAEQLAAKLKTDAGMMKVTPVSPTIN